MQARRRSPASRKKEPNHDQLTLSQVADLFVTHGPPMLKSENGVPVTYVYVISAAREKS